MEGPVRRGRVLEPTCMSLYGYKPLAIVKVVNLGIRAGVLDYSQCVRMVECRSSVEIGASGG